MCACAHRLRDERTQENLERNYVHKRNFMLTQTKKLEGTLLCAEFFASESTVLNPDVLIISFGPLLSRSILQTTPFSRRSLPVTLLSTTFSSIGECNTYCLSAGR